MTLKIEFETKNEDFKANLTHEMNRTLRLITERILKGEFIGEIKDYNNVLIGQFEYIEN